MSMAMGQILLPLIIVQTTNDALISNSSTPPILHYRNIQGMITKNKEVKEFKEVVVGPTEQNFFQKVKTFKC